MLRWKSNRRRMFSNVLSIMPKYWDTFLPDQKGREEQGGTLMAYTNVHPRLLDDPVLERSEVLPIVYADYEFGELADRERVVDFYGIKDESGDYMIVNAAMTDRSVYVFKVIGHLLGLGWGKIALASGLAWSDEQLLGLGFPVSSAGRRPMKMQIILAATEGQGGRTWRVLFQQMRDALRHPHLVERVGG